MTNEEFFVTLQQEIYARTDTSGGFTEPTFAEIVTDYLAETGSIEDFVPCYYSHTGMRIDGYQISDDRSALALYIVDYRHGSEPEALTKTEMDKKFRLVEMFFMSCLKDAFVGEMEASCPAAGLAREINEFQQDLRQVRFYLLTNALLSSSIKDLPSKSGSSWEWSYRVWDLDRLARTVGSGEPEEIVIDFPALFGQPLICLPARNEAGDVRNYLTVIPGDWLARIYDRYGGRLLEQNVRTFLQAKGKVNKGIRKTILEEPHRFFPYNNGICATAEGVEEEKRDGVMHIRVLKNLQIVNGGQTTASIFNVMKKDRSDRIAEVSVQMKLSVVDRNVAAELVPKISRFANSQNKISDSDFFSAHPFHVLMENLSRAKAAPAVDSSQILTHWFYERARGQYANATAYMTPAKKNEFLRINPRRQVISKTDLAKYVQTFRERPHEVSLGAQKNFALFAEYISDEWDKRQHVFDDLWFRRVICEAIIFRQLESVVQSAPWYANGYRANTVTYTLALFMNRIRMLGYDIDDQKIWREQTIGAGLQAELLGIGGLVQEKLIATAAINSVNNVTEWCKRKACWDAIKGLAYSCTSASLDSLGYLKPNVGSVEDSAEGRGNKNGAGLRPQDANAFENIIAAIRQSLKNGSRSRHLLIPEVSKSLGNMRAGRNIRLAIDDALNVATQRGFVNHEDGVLTLVALDNISRDKLKDQFWASMPGAWEEREACIKNFANWMGFQRVGSTIDETARSLINGLIRDDRLEAQGSEIRRIGNSK